MKVLITDDLKSANIFLKNSINWDSLGITSVLSAYDGKECIDIVNAEHPDILILDIKMPVMSGIDVMRRLTEGNYMPKTIILSAYDDFRFAQEAIRHGALDYILKPIDAENLTILLKKITGGLKLNYYEMLRNSLSNMPFGDSGIDDKSILLRLNIFKNYFAVLVRMNGSVDEFNRVEELLKAKYPLAFKLSHKELFLICDLSNAVYENEAAEIKGLIRSKGGVTAGISSIADNSLPRLREVYNQCLDALNAGFYQDGNVFLYDSLVSPGEFDAAKITEYKERIVKCILDSQHLLELDSIVGELFSEISSCMPTQDTTVDICYSILFYVVTYLFYTNNFKDTGDLGRKLLREISGYDSIDALMARFKLLLHDFIESNASVSHTESGNQIIEHLKHYLLSNYTSSLSLESISKEFYISKYELCRKFKQMENENIWDYIKKLRMEKAKSMLANTDMKIYEIAEKVGYNDPTYFSNIFKKYFKCSPQQFRSR
jgi:YesN/AraC family two-component response regulator